jgi:hypothetical protein
VAPGRALVKFQLPCARVAQRVDLHSSGGGGGDPPIIKLHHQASSRAAAAAGGRSLALVQLAARESKSQQLERSAHAFIHSLTYFQLFINNWSARLLVTRVCFHALVFFSKPIVIVTLWQLARGKSDAHGAIFNCDTKSCVLITLQLVKIVHVQIRLSVFNLKQGEWNSDTVKFIFSAIVEFI